MTPLAWGMFFIGMALGLLASVAMCLKVFKEELKSIRENYQFIKKWADLTDEQYKSFETYFEKRMNLMHDTVVNLCDINAQLASDNKESMEQIVDYSKRMHELLDNEVQQVDKMCAALVEQEDVNSERWFMMRDYILDKEDENYEHENLAEEDGAREGGNAGRQESEQAPVVSGEEDAVLVCGELEEDGLDASSETSEEEVLDF